MDNTKRNRFFVYEKNYSYTCFYKEDFKTLKEAREYVKTHEPSPYRVFVISKGVGVLDSRAKAENKEIYT